MSLLKEKLARVPSKIQSINKYLFHWNFYRIHLTYFIVTIILFSVILYGSNAGFHLSYSDAIFMCASSMTNTGLNTINLSVLTAWQQTILFLLMPMGDLTIVTVAVVYIRKHYFEKRLQEFVQTNSVAKQLADDIEKSHAKGTRQQSNGESTGILSKLQSKTSPPEKDVPYGVEHPNQVRQRTGGAPTQKASKKRQTSEMKGYGGFPAPWETQLFRRASSYPLRHFRKPLSPEHHHYISFEPSIDRKVCRGTSKHDREQLTNWIGPLPFLDRGADD